MGVEKSHVFFTRRFILAFSLIFSLLAAFPQIASAQGFLIEPIHPRPLPRILPPRPFPPETPRETPYTIESEEIVASISDSIAQVNVSQTFKNEGKTTIETSFVFPLPYDGAIDSMTLLVDGKELPAELVESSEARKQFEEIVRKARDPALLEWIGVGLFKTSVFPIPAGESRTVTMRYTQLLRSNNGLTEFLFPLSAAKYSAKPIKKVSFDVTITGDAEIKNVYSPTYDVTVDRSGKTTAKATCVLENRVPSSDFRLFFDQDANDLSAKLVSYRPNESEDGFFLLLASPKIVDEGAKPLPRTFVLCLDTSGSMMGTKIEQARESLKFILSRLRDGDKFNVVLFNSNVVSYKDALQTSSSESRQEAVSYVDAVRANGGTNIAKALERSMSLLNSDDSSNLKYLIFVSDGEPTVDETNEMKLAQIAREKNQNNARVFTFGVGYDVNARLLDRFVRDGRGQGEYIKPEENIEERISAFYSHVEAPVFSEVEFTFSLLDNADKKYFVNQVYPSGKTDLFAGEQLVMAGRYSEAGKVKISAKGKIGEREEEKLFEGLFVAKSEDSTNAFVERIWAFRRIGEIIDELDLSDNKNKELFDELVELSKKHGIMTPYTSFLAREDVQLNARAANSVEAAKNFSSLAANTGGMSGVMQRGGKQNMRAMSNLDGAQADSVAESASMAYAGGMGGGMGMGMGGGGGMAARSAGRAGAGARVLSAPARISAPTPLVRPPRENENTAEKIRTVADKTFYLRNGRWIDSSITEDMEKNAKPIEVKQFSDEYFKLVAQYGQALSQYLVFEESITVRFQGQIYNVVRADE